jgi:hypothetical protein
MTREYISVTYEDRAVRALFKEFPKIANQECNKYYKKVISEFAKEFTKRRLRRPIFDVKRKLKKKPTPKGQPPIPAKARAAGLKGVMGGINKIDKKWARFYTGNPLLLIREKGGTIRPDPLTTSGGKKRYLTIRETKTFKYRGKKRGQRAFRGTKAGLAARERWVSRYQSKIRHPVWKAGARPIVAKKEFVKVRAILGLVKLWKAFGSRAKKIVEKIPTEIARRAQLKLERKRGAA